jgi:hypothetical protein
MARGDKAAVEDELEEFVQGRYLALRRTARWGLTVPPGFAQQAEQAITPYLDQSRKP